MPAPTNALVTLRVLVVENDYFSAIEVKGWLQAEQALVLGPVASVRQALDLIETGEPPDLAVLDVNLGAGEMVYPVAARLGELGTPFVFLTGEPNIQREFQDRPRVGKPCGKANLLNALRKLAKA